MIVAEEVSIFCQIENWTLNWKVETIRLFAFPGLLPGEIEVGLKE